MTITIEELTEETLTGKLQNLTQEWIEAKVDEKEANTRRLSAEAHILELCKNQIKITGTTNLSTGLKIVCGFTEKWCQDTLVKLHAIWPKKVKFPFRTEYKPMNGNISELKEDMPELANMLNDALTVSASKPSFSFKGE